MSAEVTVTAPLGKADAMIGKTLVLLITALSLHSVMLEAQVLPGTPVSLVSKQSGQCLDVPYWSGSNWGTAPATRLQQYTCWGGNMQQYVFTPVPGGYEITAQVSGLQ